MRYATLLIFTILLGSNTTFAYNFDSLRSVLSYSDTRADFKRVDSLLTSSTAIYNSLEQKKLIQTAVERTEELGFEHLFGLFTLRQSIVETLNGDFGTAIRLAKDALKILSKYNCIETAACYNTIAGMVDYLGDTEAAMDYMKKADQICSLFVGKPKYDLHRCNNDLMWGNIYISVGEYEKSENYLLKAVKEAEQGQFRASEIYANLNLSKVELKRKDFKRCFEYLDKALELSKKYQLYNLEAITNIEIAQTYLAQGKNKAAIVKFLQAEVLAENQNLGDRLLTIYKSLSKLYKESGNLNRAFYYQEKYITTFEEQKQKEKEEQLELLQFRFKMSEKNAIINNLALEKSQEETKKNYLQLAIFITIALLIILILIFLLLFNRNQLIRKLESEKLEREVSSFQLTALKSQMNPHFIFNALNSIQDLILKENTEESYTYISLFADLVRKTLNHSNKDFIDIEDEFDSIRVYLALEKLRFQDDLEIDIVTNSINNITIPPLLIQPFLENAIKHGLMHYNGVKKLSIKFELADNLICTIEDNGIGRAASLNIQSRRLKNHPSFATQSIERRFDIFKKIYGQQVGILYEDLEKDGRPVGTRVIINLPFKQNF